MVLPSSPEPMTPPVTNTPQPHVALAPIISILTLIIVVGGYLVAAQLYAFWPYSVPKMVACTQEAKICPDGSSVGRLGPRCEFAACPEPVTYMNKQYGFTVSLPQSWQGYTSFQLSTPITDQKNNTLGIFITVSIRHPLWTKANPRQDIPIDVFTVKQWQQIQNGTISVSAAPIPPSELARNDQFVFALPARYNYAYPSGFEEVQSIIAEQPITVFEPTEGSTFTSGLSGTIYMGPICPVERVDDSACHDRLFQGQFIVRNASDSTEVAKFSTDSNGQFKVTLAPGAYLIEPVQRIGVGKQTQPVEVTPDTVTEITLTFDTGIR